MTEKITCALICDKGFEDIVAKDLKNYDFVKIIEIKSTAILFSVPKKDWHLLLAEMCYTFQGAIKLISNVEQFAVDIELKKTAENMKDGVTIIEKFVKENTTPQSLKISCVRNGTHNYKSIDVGAEIGRNFFREIPKVYDSPDLEIIVYIIDNQGYVGIDFSGRNLSKRDYKLFTGAASLRGTIAYNLFRFSGATEKDVILDPFMGSGTIVIEAGLYLSKTSPFHFSKTKFAFCSFIKEDWLPFFKKLDSKRSDKQFEVYGYDGILKFLKYSQKNAKIADVNKNINLSKVAIDWIDTKVNENTITKIITHPPYSTDHGSASRAAKVYKDLFYQAEFILKVKGEVTLITNRTSSLEIKKSAEEFGFTLIEERVVYEGQQEMIIIKYKLNKKLDKKPKLEKSTKELDDAE